MSIRTMLENWDRYRTTNPSADLHKDYPEYKWAMAVDLMPAPAAMHAS